VYKSGGQKPGTTVDIRVLMVEMMAMMIIMMMMVSMMKMLMCAVNLTLVGADINGDN
jgi:hypothetical protein